MNAGYKKEFRAEAVRLSITGDKSISQTAKDFGVNETTLYNWVAKARKSEILYHDNDGVKSTAEIMNEVLCKVIHVSRSGYYAFISRSLCLRDEKDQRLTPMVQEIFKENRKVYGYRHISNELKGRGENHELNA